MRQGARGRREETCGHRPAEWAQVLDGKRKRTLVRLSRRPEAKGAKGEARMRQLQEGAGRRMGGATGARPMRQRARQGSA